MSIGLFTLTSGVSSIFLLSESSCDSSEEMDSCEFMKPLPQADLGGIRLGVIGKPSDWLISSDVDYALKAKARLNAEIIDIPMEELLSRLISSPESGWSSRVECLSAKSGFSKYHLIWSTACAYLANSSETPQSQIFAALKSSFQPPVRQAICSTAPSPTTTSCPIGSIKS